MKTFWERAEKIPPVLVRLLARRGRSQPMTEHEISSSSGLDPYKVYVISNCTSWDGIDLNTMFLFLVACRCDFENRREMKRIETYLQTKPTWQFLRRSTRWKSYYEPLMIRYLESVKPK